MTNATGCRYETELVEGAEIITPTTDTALANIQAQVWIEAKDFTKSMLASDSVAHIDLLFDGKVQQLRKGAAV